MNLWNLFPEFLLDIDGILQLPYLAMLIYTYVFYAMVRNKGQRIYLTVFVLLTLVASVIMIKNLGPPIGKIIPPAALMLVMIMPMVVLFINLYKKAYNEARLWLVVTLAGWLHSISWSVWLFALAGS